MREEGPFGAQLESESFDAHGFRVEGLEGVERISEPFRFLVSTRQLSTDALALDDLIGTELSLALTIQGREVRRFSGMIRRITRQLEVREHAAYTFELVPRFTRAQLVTNVRVHVAEKLDEIIRQRLTLFGLEEGEDFQLRIAPRPVAQAITIQYRETDFDFLSRLLEHHGLAYFFLQESEREVLVIVDAPSCFEKLGGDPLHFGRTERDDAGRRSRMAWGLEEVRQLVPKNFVCRDYNHRTPTLLLTSERISMEEGDFGGVFEYGLHAQNVDEATVLARRLSAQHLASRDRFRGHCNRPELSAGHRFELNGHPIIPTELLLEEVEHSLRFDAASDGWIYQNTFVAVPASRMVVPDRRTPIPRIHGLVPAVVQTDAAGTLTKHAKIDGDGCYYVHFHFDPTVPGQTPTSCPVRMIQPSAGPGYGVHFPLRPGVEVLIAFIGGDPDRPVIVGAVPNAVTPSPVTQSNSTKNRIRTGSGAMIEFDDGT